MGKVELTVKLDSIPQMADRALAGLQAGPDLRLRIQMEAIRKEQRRKTMMSVGRAATAVCCAVLVLALILNPQQRVQEFAAPSITSLPLGSGVESSDEPAVLGEASIQGGRQNADSGIWAASENGAFPLIGLKGSYYRQMTISVSIPSSQLTEVGSVEEFTTEPSLSDASIISSNCVNAGETIYAVTGMESTFLAAQSSGRQCLFQRVSFNGKALTQSETLADTLQLKGHIQSMTLSGKGTVQGESAEALFDTLVNNSVYESSGALSTDSVLTITTDSGLSAQMLVRDDRLSACGIWSCPEFFEAFDKNAD